MLSGKKKGGRGGGNLVEVGVEEADHIRAWPSATVGAEVPIPDLDGHGLTFRGDLEEIARTAAAV